MAIVADDATAAAAKIPQTDNPNQDRGLKTPFDDRVECRLRRVRLLTISLAAVVATCAWVLLIDCAALNVVVSSGSLSRLRVLLLRVDRSASVGGGSFVAGVRLSESALLDELREARRSIRQLILAVSVIVALIAYTAVQRSDFPAGVVDRAYAILTQLGIEDAAMYRASRTPSGGYTISRSPFPSVVFLVEDVVRPTAIFLVTMAVAAATAFAAAALAGLRLRRFRMLPVIAGAVAFSALSRDLQFAWSWLAGPTGSGRQELLYVAWVSAPPLAVIIVAACLMIRCRDEREQSCGACGYSLRGLPADQLRCPECGGDVGTQARSSASAAEGS